MSSEKYVETIKVDGEFLVMLDDNGLESEFIKIDNISGVSFDIHREDYTGCWTYKVKIRSSGGDFFDSYFGLRGSRDRIHPEAVRIAKEIMSIVENPELYMEEEPPLEGPC